MNPAITGALISGGSKLLGGLLGGGGRKPHAGIVMAANEARTAERYGFNPLTLLGAGTAMPGSGPGPLTSTGAIAGTVGDILMEATGTNDALEEQREKAELDRLRKENEILNAGGAGEVLTKTVTVNQGGTSTPKPEPDFMDTYLADPGGFTEMRNIQGKPIRVRNDVAARLGLPPGSLYGMAEDAEMIFGEVGGEITGIGNLGDDLFSHVEGNNIVKRGGPPTLTKEPVPQLVPPSVKYPSVTSVPAHQNPTDIENILKNRYKNDEDDSK